MLLASALADYAGESEYANLSAYLGNSTKFDNAVADFAEVYADQNERDHGALAAAVAAGQLEAKSGV